MKSPDTLSTRSSWMPISTTAGSFMPKIASSCRGKKRKKMPMNAAPASPKRAAMCTACSARSGWPAPRFWPATAAAAPISPIDVQVISEKSWVYDDGERRLRRGALRQRADERQHEHAADVHRDPLDAGRQAEPEQRADDRPVRPIAVAARERHDPPAAPELQDRVERDETRSDHRPHRRAGGAERRDRARARGSGRRSARGSAPSWRCRGPSASARRRPSAARRSACRRPACRC